VGVLGVVVVAGLSGKGNGDTGSSPAGTASSIETGSAATAAGGGAVAGTDDNPGAVDGSDLTVPQSTQLGVVLETTLAPIQKTTLSATITKGFYGDDVKKVQQRLTDLGFQLGPVDGAFGAGTQQAVWAYKKLVMGVPRDELDASEVASQVTPEMWQQMQDPIQIQPRRPLGVGRTHVEIYLPQQVMIVFTDDKPTLIAHISSGSEETWCETLEYNTDVKGDPIDPPRTSDECGVSHTPGGVFKFYRRYDGDRQGPLGGMYNPVYFNYGIAVHGALKVPLHPASHGCIRINMDLSKIFPSLVKNGNRVYVWGQDGREPESYTKHQRTPPFNYPDPNATTTTSTTTTTPSTTADASSTSSATPTTKPSTATTPTATTTKPSATTAVPVTAPPPTGTASAPTTAAPVSVAPASTSPAPGP
jgi:hypothetical protein